jgi:hypothetical protein
MAAITLLFAYMSHYLFQLLLLARFDEKKAAAFHAMAQKMALFTMGALLSASMLHYSNFMAIMAWINLVILITKHCFIFIDNVPNRYRIWGFALYYGCLLIWYAGILIIFIMSAFF